MLGKLFKHEMKSYRFTMGITFLVALVFTVCSKVMCMLPYQGEAKNIIQMICFFSVYYGIMFVTVVAQILIVIRFYSTTVGDRGYLTWTLPAKTSEILWSKALAGGIWYGISLLVVIFCYAFFLVGDYWTEELDVYGEMLGMFSELFRMIDSELAGGVILAVCLYVITCIVLSFASFMVIYMCIAIGQLFGKWRIIASIGAYLLFMFLVQIMAIVAVFVFTVIGVGVMEQIEIDNPIVILNIVLVIVDLIGIVGYVGLFAITNSIFKKHLNLE